MIRSAESPFTETLKLLWKAAAPETTLIVIGIFALVYWLIISRMDQEWRKTI